MKPCPRHVLAPLTLLTLAACGGGSPPVGPSQPPTGTVGVVLFYDENANGMLDAEEMVRIPQALVSVAGQSARTAEATGRAVFSGIPEGRHAVTVDTATLPPFYSLGQEMLSVQVPQAGGDLNVPITLPIGANRPNTYMAFGNSITDGTGHTDGLAYRGSLQEKLLSYFGRAEVINQGLGSTSSLEGAARIADTLRAERPAYTLIHYGTNDFNKSGCRRIETIDTCFTIPSLRMIVQEVRAAGSLPVLATIIPSNTGFDFRAPPQRNEWVSIQDERIRTLAAEEGALLADLEPAFLQAGPLDTLFEDHIHPNETGFELMAQGFFDAIAHAQTPSNFVPVGAFR